MRILFLDDESNRMEAFRSKYPQSWIVARSQEAIASIKSEEWDLVCLDHDLANGDNGMRVVEWIERASPPVIRVSTFIVHSRNAPYGMLMVKRLTAAGYFAQYVPFDERCWAGPEDEFRYQR